jgi:hypothetical protein
VGEHAGLAAFGGAAARNSARRRGMEIIRRDPRFSRLLDRVDPRFASLATGLTGRYPNGARFLATTLPIIDGLPGIWRSQ